MGNNHSQSKFLHIAIAVALFLCPVIGRADGVVNSASEAALNSALAGGGTVTFGFDGTITVTSPKTISTNTVIDAGGHNITLSGGGSSQLFLVSTGASLTLANLTIANGHTSTNGGAIYNQGTLAAFNCFFTNNVAVGTNGPDGANGHDAIGVAMNGSPGAAGGSTCGGAIYTSGATMVTGCSFFNNSATGGSSGSGGTGGSGTTGGNGGNSRAAGSALGGQFIARIRFQLRTALPLRIAISRAILPPEAQAEMAATAAAAAPVETERTETVVREETVPGPLCLSSKTRS